MDYFSAGQRIPGRSQERQGQSRGAAGNRLFLPGLLSGEGVVAESVRVGAGVPVDSVVTAPDGVTAVSEAVCTAVDSGLTKVTDAEASSRPILSSGYRSVYNASMRLRFCFTVNRVRSGRIDEISLCIPGHPVPRAPVFPDRRGDRDDRILFNKNTLGICFSGTSRIYGRKRFICGIGQAEGIKRIKRGHLRTVFQLEGRIKIRVYPVGDIGGKGNSLAGDIRIIVQIPETYGKIWACVPQRPDEGVFSPHSTRYLHSRNKFQV